MAEPSQIVCPHCGAVNRLPGGRDASIGKCGRCHNALFDGHPHPVTAASFDRQISRNDIPVVVDFWAEWCGPCKMMAPIFDKMARDLEPQIRFLKVDTDAEQGLAQRYSIRSIPTLMLFRGGAVAAHQAGAMPEHQLRTWLRQNAGIG